MTSAVDLLTLALKDIGALGIGQSISAEDTADALATLNMMLGQWQAERLSVYHLIDTAVQATGALSYTVGPGGDFNAPRPIKIESAFVRLNNIDFPCMLIPSREDYNRIGIKTLSSLPNAVYYDAAFSLGTVYFWPVPNASYELHITTMDALPQFSTPGAQINLPAPYLAAIRYNLGVYLAPSYQLDPMRALVALAANAKRVVKRMNVQISQLTMPAGVLGRSRYNIYTGGAH
jgi:hypothetical protein